jgi:hypothetical protein
MRWILVVVVLLGTIALAISFMGREPGSERASERSGSATEEARAVTKAPPMRAVTPEPPPAQSPSPVIEHDLDPEQREMVELARIMMSNSMSELFPNLDLSEEEIEGLAIATVRLRQAQLRLEELESGPGDAELGRELEDEVPAAADEFAELMDMSLESFDGDGVDAAEAGGDSWELFDAFGDEDAFDSEPIDE